MNLSMLQVINILSTNFRIEDINFILTVLRDNCLDDETYEYINKLLKGSDKQ